MKHSALLFIALVLFASVASLYSPQVKALPSTEKFTNGNFDTGDSTGWSLSANCTVVNQYGDDWRLRVVNQGTFSQTFSSPVQISRIRYFYLDELGMSAAADCYFDIYFNYSDSSYSTAYVDEDYVSYWYGYSGEVDLYDLMDNTKSYLSSITIVYNNVGHTLYWDEFSLLTTTGGSSFNERIVDGSFETGEYLDFYDTAVSDYSSDSPHSGNYHLSQYSSPAAVLAKNFSSPLSIESMSTFHFYCASYGYGTSKTTYWVDFYYYSGSSDQVILDGTFNGFYRYYDLLLYIDEGEEALSGFKIEWTSSTTWGLFDDISLMADDYFPPEVRGDDIYYFRSDTWNVSSELGYKLQTENTFVNSTASLTLGAGETSVSVGIRVWKYNVWEEAEELTDGEPDGVVSLGATYYGEAIGYLVSGKHMEVIDHIKVIVYLRSGTEEWQAKAQFLTGSGDDDIQNYLICPNSTWGIHYWLNFTSEEYFEFHYGDRYTRNSYIQTDLPRADPWRISAARMQRQDFYGTVTTPWVWVFGANLFWSILLLGCITFMYMKHGSYKMILLLCWILGGVGSFLWVIIPSAGLVAAALMLAFAMAGTLFKIFHR